MKLTGRKSKNVLDLRGPHKNTVQEEIQTQVMTDNARLFNKTPMAKQKTDPLEELINSWSFAGNKNPVGRIREMGVSPQRGFSRTAPAQKLRKK